ncbi:Predicted acetyltransferase, GNAT superfamily [Aneurinibacillus thermoaerophilus]|uniref:Predicted acetyltransferase, GNAT superfamily n=1 Tax=Aneurinibacillus thermoaerophilus TaxID=143495 RepID=A0A1G8CTA5_ANETH|nr:MULTISPECIES: hypothetical protein [Aneurinibacillus]AMA74490.1 hypothetical protein ACH33_18055 [Aneurinibacillus sp. XH2]MED0679079.1 GNAT family N-acetyltransferase [Aneurinibacillus thermoaerophilus]MED0764524.1 GNAT family N-acetyltransferase [Aneurinibacillus thermoaerophilus]SDH48712.1 Predicted acetyltransferase, GNAT superfamily [Aneurinibacillus thermoaerophilus]
MKDQLTILAMNTVEEIERITELEKQIWQTDTPMPVDQMLTAAKHGGIVLGAFVGERLVGFQYSFAGYNGQKAYVCSHMLGTHPDFRHMKIGEKLKWAQREEALKLGYDLVTWTYDPLELVNGYLNIHKLGAVCSTYIENCYGNMQDSLNSGIASDRFQVEWHIRSERVARRAKGELTPKAEIPKKFLMDWRTDIHNDPVPGKADWRQLQENHVLYVPVPAYFQQIKRRNKPLAIAWREAAREVFARLFCEGWAVTDVIRNDKEAPVHFYVLHKKGECMV